MGQSVKKGGAAFALVKVSNKFESFARLLTDIYARLIAHSKESGLNVSKSDMIRRVLSKTILFRENILT